MAYPAAVRWDTATQDHELDADGRHVEVHPIDAAVAIRLGFRRGTIAGDPTTGHTLDKVDMAQTPEALRLDVERRQIAALGNLVTDGLVDQVVVKSEVDHYGRLSVLTKYRNTRTGKPGTVSSG